MIRPQQNNFLIILEVEVCLINYKYKVASFEEKK